MSESVERNRRVDDAKESDPMASTHLCFLLLDTLLPHSLLLYLVQLLHVDDDLGLGIVPPLSPSPSFERVETPPSPPCSPAPPPPLPPSSPLLNESCPSCPDRLPPLVNGEGV